MTDDKIAAFVKQCQDNIRKSFKWEFFPASHTHLLVCVRYNGTECYIYPEGRIMTEAEFENELAYRKDIKIDSAFCFHRGTAKF